MAAQWREVISSQKCDVIIVGGGIIGLATAFQLTEAYPLGRIVVLEKEDNLASHQTGHNSGVVHSGIYYRPDSDKARFCRTGAASLIHFCHENGVKYEQIGKVIVASSESELAGLHNLYSRGVENGVKGLEIIDQNQLKEIEPYAKGIKALHVPETGIVDFKAVAAAYATKFLEGGGDILTGSEVVSITRSHNSMYVETRRESLETRYLINCAGLYSDKVARMAGVKPSIRIIPFRGEYYTLRPKSRHLVKGLIYPVPDPKFPFLGVHFTRNIHDQVEAGPNAVLAWAREGYRKTDFNLTDTMEIVGYPGFWAMSLKFWRTGVAEFYRSLNKSTFVKDLQKLLPKIQDDDLVFGGSGVRAQAVDSKGRLLDDFRIEEDEQSIHVLNAPSPGATSSISIGKHIVKLASQSFGM